ncbi:MAG: NrtA/SsuA/CpmA family ABC transporter substrate-binding protein [Proteobacteria bacterium]|nr:NrtA/SsuA/CpmA family ABC transporter substrate-binding protein [Pseudomonadota bacterium]
MPIFIANEKRYFSDEGLDVTIKPHPSGKKAMEGMFAGEVKLSTVTDIPIVFNSFIRNDFVVIATFAYSYNNCKVLGRKDKGIKSPEDLKGKKIGTPFSTAAHFFSHVYLSEYGITKSDVKIIDIPAQDLPEALQSGKIDAIVIFEPYAYQADKALPDNVVRLPESRLYRETFNLIAMKQFANEHPELLKKIVRSLDKAIEFIKSNKKESIAVIINKTNMEEFFLVSIWDDFVYQLSLDRSLLISMEDEARWAIKNRFTDKTKVPNYLGYFYPDAMKAVKPKAVTIIK